MPSWSVSLPKSEHTRWFVEEVQPYERSLRSYPFRCGFEHEQDVPDRVTGLAESVGYIRGILAGLR